MAIFWLDLDEGRIMDVKIRTEKTITLSMTEPQAIDLLRLSRAIGRPDLDDTFDNPSGTLETLDNIRQALLSAGLQLKDAT